MYCDKFFRKQRRSREKKKKEKKKKLEGRGKNLIKLEGRFCDEF